MPSTHLGDEIFGASLTKQKCDFYWKLQVGGCTPTVPSVGAVGEIMIGLGMIIETGWFSYAVIGAFCSEGRLSAVSCVPLAAASFN
jgi:hypothetical protein